MVEQSRFIARALPVLCILCYVGAVTFGLFSGGAWASLGIGLAVLLFLCLWGIEAKPPLPSKQLSLFTLAALALFGAEAPFSFDPGVSFHVWLQLISIFLPLLLLTSEPMRRAVYSPAFIPAVVIAAATGALGLGLELQSGGAFLHMLKKPETSLTEYNRGIAHMAILAFPLFAGLWLGGGKRAAGALALLLLFPASLAESHTAKLALFAGAACAAVAFYRPVWMRNLLAAAAVAIMGWPFYAQKIFSSYYDSVEHWHNSWRHRMEIWDYLSYRIAERPFFGWGLGTTHLLDFSHPHGDLYVAATGAAPHAHNFVTELWVETGLVGLAFGLAFLLWSLRACMRLHPSLRPFALGGWASAVTVAMFGFDFWTDSLWAAFALSAFAFGIVQEGIERGDNVADI